MEDNCHLSSNQILMKIYSPSVNLTKILLTSNKQHQTSIAAKFALEKSGDVLNYSVVSSPTTGDDGKSLKIDSLQAFFLSIKHFRKLFLA